ncbi:MAG: methyltransferase domain-containing protein [Planctomycetaceae bacterium]|nr:methyltransferase domain-containing protein [Planctomycetaceae bacterium]
MSKAAHILEGFSHSYQNTCIVGAAAELDLFTPMIRSPLTAAELARQRETDLRATVMLLDALVALEVLRKSSNTEPVYSVRDEYRELLDIGHPKTFVPMLRHRMTCIRQWVELARVLKSGQPQDRVASLLGPAEDYRSFVLAMHSVGVMFAAEVVDSLEQAGCLKFRHLLDVGGASGTYTLEMLKRLPHAQATIFDLPPAIEEARKRFVGSPFEARIRLAAGDFYADELPVGCDFAWVSAIIHQFDRQHAQMLYAKVHRVLESGGVIAVRDFVMQPDRTVPLDGAMFAINMLTATQTGMCYTFDEIREDLEISGFSDVRYAVPADTMGAVVTAAK